MANNQPAKTDPNAIPANSDIFSAMRRELDNVFERFETGWPRWTSPFGAPSDRLRPDLDVRDDGTSVTIEADLPGIDEKNMAVTVANGVLTIKGERRDEREEKKSNYYVSERSYGVFERSLRLPETVDESKLEAKFANGVLTVTAPKRPDAVRSEKRIEIKKA